MYDLKFIAHGMDVLCTALMALWLNVCGSDTPSDMQDSISSYARSTVAAGFYVGAHLLALAGAIDADTLSVFAVATLVVRLYCAHSMWMLRGTGLAVDPVIQHEYARIACQYSIFLAAGPGIASFQAVLALASAVAVPNKARATFLAYVEAVSFVITCAFRGNIALLVVGLVSVIGTYNNVYPLIVTADKKEYKPRRAFGAVVDTTITY